MGNSIGKIAAVICSIGLAGGFVYFRATGSGAIVIPTSKSPVIAAPVTPATEPAIKAITTEPPFIVQYTPLPTKQSPPLFSSSKSLHIVDPQQVVVTPNTGTSLPITPWEDKPASRPAILPKN
jgi:hypothetical protein